MDFRLILALLLVAGFGAGSSTDTSDVNRFHKPLLPGASTGASNAAPGSADLSNLAPVLISVGPQSKGKGEPLQPQSRLEIVRYVSGEFAKVLRPIPSGKKGYRITVGQKVDEGALRSDLRKGGAAANPGDTVQVTGIEFREKEIVVQINGGGKSHFNIRDHVQVGVGGQAAPGTGPSQTQQQATGGTIVLDFGKQVPDMSADDLMTDLQPFLDFTREHSGAVNWVDTLPPQFKDAIQNREAVLGIPSGDETEDWIYGSPPARTTFVTFAGDKVIRVEQFN
jgi:hypothetical protein